MEITRDNYEIYFLDFFEKKLNPTQMEELMLFLEENPDLKKEFGDFEMITITDKSQINFPFKKNLLKNTLAINESNYQDYMVALIEGQLNQNEIDELNSFVSRNPKLLKELDAFRNTILKPDVSVKFPHKNKLKHYNILSFHYSANIRYALAAAAASVAVIIGLFFILRSPQPPVNISQKSPRMTIIESELPHAAGLPENTSIAAANSSKTIPRDLSPKANNPLVLHQLAESDFEKIEMIKPLKASDIAYLQVIFDEQLAYRDVNNSVNDNLYADSQRATLEDRIVAGAMKTLGIASLPTHNSAARRDKINNFWDVAFIVSKAYNNIFDKNIKLNQKFNDNGDLVAVNFRSALIDFDKNIK